MFRNNSVYDADGNVIGYRCDICGKVAVKMWGIVCNECRRKYEHVRIVTPKIEDTEHE